MSKLTSVAFSGYYLREKGNNETVFGRNVAAVELLVNFMKHLTVDEICFSYVKDNYQYHMIRRLYNKIARNHPIHTNLKLINRIDMLQKNVRIESDIIHDCLEDFFHTAFLRDKYSTKHPPISITIHCASQPDIITSSIIPVMLSGLMPYDTIFCSSQAVKNVLSGQFDNFSMQMKELYGVTLKRRFRLDIVPLGIDDDNFNRIDKDKAKSELGIPVNTFVILFFGRVSAFFKSDLMPLIRVVKNLVDKNPGKNIQLVIAGTENKELHDYKYIKRFIGKLNLSNNTIIYETFDDQKRNVLFSGADVFTSPADNVQETFGLTLLEAMACGVPQVVSDWNGYKETVRHGETGFKVPTYWSKCDRDISEFPHAVMDELYSDKFYSHLLMGQSVAIDLKLYEYYLQVLVDNDRLRQKMEENSIRIFRNCYTLKKTIGGYETVWKELIREKEVLADEPVKPYLDLFSNKYSEIFSEYPTRFIETSEELVITQLGKEVLSDAELIPWHYSEEKLLNEVNTAMDLLTHMQTVDSISYGALTNLCRIDVAEFVAGRSVMWLLKHGFIAIRHQETGSDRSL